MNTISPALLPTLLAAILAACASAPPSPPELDAAQSASELARGHPFAQRASVELERAQASLAQARRAWTEGRDAAATRQLAYVARRQAEIAMATATQAGNEQRVAQASAERERLVLAARTREAEAARAGAQLARAEADQARRLAAAEAQRASDLMEDLADLEAQVTDRGLVVTLGDVLFSTGGAALQPGARRTVERIAEVMRQYPERRLLVEGFTDSTGSESANLALSQRRAAAFASALAVEGVDAERIETRARGEADPVADNTTAAGRQRNRRVEVLFSDAQGRLSSR